MRPRQDGRHTPDDIFKCIFLNEDPRISLKKSLKFVPKVRINNILALGQIMAWRRSGDKPFSEPMMVDLLTHICVTRPQWVNHVADQNQRIQSKYVLGRMLQSHDILMMSKMSNAFELPRRQHDLHRCSCGSSCRIVGSEPCVRVCFSLMHRLTFPWCLYFYVAGWRKHGDLSFYMDDIISSASIVWTSCNKWIRPLQ